MFLNYYIVETTQEKNHFGCLSFLASDYKKTTYCENPDSKTERTSRCPDGIHIYECIFTAPVINTAVSFQVIILKFSHTKVTQFSTNTGNWHTYLDVTH